MKCIAESAREEDVDTLPGVNANGAYANAMRKGGFRKVRVLLLHSPKTCLPTQAYKLFGKLLEFGKNKPRVHQLAKKRIRHETARCSLVLQLPKGMVRKACELRWQADG